MIRSSWLSVCVVLAASYSSAACQVSAGAGSTLAEVGGWLVNLVCALRRPGETLGRLCAFLNAPAGSMVPFLGRGGGGGTGALERN